MMNKPLEAVEVDLLFAKSEFQYSDDPSALARALNHIENALDVVERQRSLEDLRLEMSYGGFAAVAERALIYVMFAIAELHVSDQDLTSLRERTILQLRMAVAELMFAAPNFFGEGRFKSARSRPV